MISGPSQCCFEYNTDYYGSDIGAELNVVSAEECQRICAGRTGCNYFTYITLDSTLTEIHKKCHLKSGTEGKRDGAGMISGPVQC